MGEGVGHQQIAVFVVDARLGNTDDGQQQHRPASARAITNTTERKLLPSIHATILAASLLDAESASSHTR